MNKLVDLKRLKNPNIVKDMDEDALKDLCAQIRQELLEDVSACGGHLSSNLGIVELTVALYRSFDFPKDKLLFDVGHQCYVHKILTGRDLSKLNEFDGPSGFIKREESPYDCFEAGHSSTALSGGEAFAIARDMNGEDFNVVVLIGDASLANGVSFEALNNIACRKNKVIIVLNDNDMSISKPVGGLENFLRSISPTYDEGKAKQPDIKLNSKTIFEELGLEYIGPVNGHDIQALDQAFKKAKRSKKSVIVHTFTKKGKGYSYAENDVSGDWHYTAPFDIDTGLPKNKHENQISFSKFMGDLSCEALEKNPNAILICPAMVKGSLLESAFNTYPERCFDMGISEEHAGVFTGAITLQGIHPILCMYSTFLQRAYDEIFHDCARIHADMTLLVDRVGLIGKNGETHMGIYDVAFLRSIPNVIITMPSTLSEARALMDLSMEKGHGVFAIRYLGVFENLKETEKREKLEFLRWKIVQKGNHKKQAILALGPHGKELFDKLIQSGYDGTLVNPLFLNPLDQKIFQKLLPYEEIVVYDAYGIENGFSESVKKYLFENHFSGKTTFFSLPNAFIAHDSVENQEKRYGISVNQIYDYILKKS